MECHNERHIENDEYDHEPFDVHDDLSHDADERRYSSDQPQIVQELEEHDNDEESLDDSSSDGILADQVTESRDCI